MRVRNRTATQGRGQTYHWLNLPLIQPRGAAEYSYWLIFIFLIGSSSGPLMIPYLSQLIAFCYTSCVVKSHVPYDTGGSPA